jgi:hypothetical protein
MRSGCVYVNATKDRFHGVDLSPNQKELHKLLPFQPRLVYEQAKSGVTKIGCHVDQRTRVCPDRTKETTDTIWIIRPAEDSVRVLSV